LTVRKPAGASSARATGRWRSTWKRQEKAIQKLSACLDAEDFALSYWAILRVPRINRARVTAVASDHGVSTGAVLSIQVVLAVAAREHVNAGTAGFRIPSVASITVSLPSQPFRTSLPFWPRMMSFPPGLLIVSLPFPPQMTSSPEVPFKVSDRLVPVIAHSADATRTVVVSTSELLALTGSVTAEDTEAVFEIVVPLNVPGFTFTTSVKVASPPLDREATGQLTVPMPPTEGSVHPVDGEIETNVVLVGTESVSVEVDASGPLLCTVIV